MAKTIGKAGVKTSMLKTQIIRNALVEYERNHYETENQKWQKTINALIAKTYMKRH